MAVSDDRKYTSEFVYQLLEGVKGRTLGDVDKSHQFARTERSEKITGIAGDVIEQSVFGYERDSNQECDIEIDGVLTELKTTGESVNCHPTPSNMFQNPHLTHASLNNQYLRLDSHLSSIYQNNMSRTLRTSTLLSLSGDNKYTRGYLLSRIHKLHLQGHFAYVVLLQAERIVFVACSLFNPPFAIRIDFDNITLGNSIKRPITGMHEASIGAIPIPIVSRTKMVA